MSATNARISFGTLKIIEISSLAFSIVPPLILLVLRTGWDQTLTVLGWVAYLVLVSLIFRPLYMRRLPEVSDGAFLADYRTRFAPPYDRVLSEREALAELLGIPRTKIGVDTRLESITKRLSLLDQVAYRVGLGDLDNELLTRLDRERLRSIGFEDIRAGQIIDVFIRWEKPSPPGNSEQRTV